MITQWSERFSLHQEILDDQHKELFRLANLVRNLNIKTTTREKLGSLFKEFFYYMEHHFKEEEAYMQSIEYPYLEQHHQFHQSIIDGMTKILREKKTMEELQISMKFITQKWLVEHILENDLKIEKWRKSTIVSQDDMLDIH